MNIDQFGMDTITLAGPLEAKLRAVRDAGFTQIMLQARDIAGHPDGDAAAIEAVRASGLRVTGFQVLRDFEGLSGRLHAYKLAPRERDAAGLGPRAAHGSCESRPRHPVIPHARDEDC